MAKVNEAALIHFLLGIAKPEVIPVGHHDLSRVQITLTCPDYAAVDRAAGDQKDDKGNLLGNGLDAKDAPPLAMSLNGVFQLLKRAGVELSDSMWAEAWRADLKGEIAQPPAEALAGLAIVQKEQPDPEPVLRPTPCKRTGTKEITWKFKRLPKAAKKVKAMAG